MNRYFFAALVSFFVSTAVQAQAVLGADAGTTILQLQSNLQGQHGTTKDISKPYLWLGGEEWAYDVGADWYGIAFGYHTPGQTPPVTIGQRTETASGDTLGSFVIATRQFADGSQVPQARVTVSSQGTVYVGTAPDGGTPADNGTGAKLQVDGYISSEGDGVPTVNDPHYEDNPRPQTFKYSVPLQLDSTGHTAWTWVKPYGLGGGYCWFSYYYTTSTDVLALVTYDNFGCNGVTCAGINIYGTPSKYVLALCLGGQPSEE